MAKALKTVGTIAGAVASIAAFIPGGQAIAAVAGAVALVSNAGAQMLAKPPPARGAINNIVIDADAPMPYLIGRTFSAGVLRYDTSFGGTVKKVPNPYRFLVVVYSGAGPLDGLEQVTADFVPQPFNDAGALTGYYNNWLSFDRQLGLTPEYRALTAHLPGLTGWGAASKLSGKAALGFSARFDKDGKVFASGLPQMGTVWRGARVYDPRLDSSRSGGAGAHRALDEGTYAYSDSPALHGLTYALGRYQNGVKVMGIGLPVDGIDVDAFTAFANVCAANGWTVGGTVFEPGDRWANLKDILAAGGGEPIFAGGRLSVKFDAPRVALDRITRDDLADEDWSVTAMQGWTERLNGIVPKYRSEPHQWEYVQTDEVTVSTYLAEDGEEKVAEQQWNMVQSAAQVGQLAAYRLVNGRELGPIEIPCKPRLRRYRSGDKLIVHLPEDGLVEQPAVVLTRAIDPATFAVQLVLIGETDDKHAFALGRTSVPPATPQLQVDPAERDALAAAVLRPTDLTLDEVLAGTEYVHTTPAQVEKLSGIEAWATVGMTAEEAARLAAAAATAQAASDVADAASVRADDAIRLLTEADDDGTLTIREKITRLKPLSAELEDAFVAIVGSADALGVNRTTIVNARADWINLRDSLVPAWNDITQDTPVPRNSLDGALEAYRNAFADLRQRIEAKAAQTANNSQIVNDDGRAPEPYSTRGALPTERATLDSVNAAVTVLNSDSTLTVVEKRALIPAVRNVQDRWGAAQPQAAAWGVDFGAAANAIGAMNSLLAGISPAWDNTNFDSPNTDGGLIRSRLYTASALVADLDGRLKAEAATRAKWSKTLNDDGRKADDYANYGASAEQLAQLAAAKAKADAAIAAIAKITDDDLLSADEKPGVMLQRSELLNRVSAAISASLKLAESGVSDPTAVQRAALDTKFSAFNSYLAGLSPAWDDTSADTQIVGADFRDKFSGVYGALGTLEEANVTEAAKTAYWSRTKNDDGTKAANYATAGAFQSEAQDIAASKDAIAKLLSADVLDTPKKIELVNRKSELDNRVRAARAASLDLNREGRIDPTAAQRQAQETAWVNVNNYLANNPTWSDLSVTTQISGAQLSSLFAAGWDAVSTLEQANAAFASRFADWPYVQGEGTPDSYANYGASPLQAQQIADATSTLNAIVDENVIARSKKTALLASINDLQNRVQGAIAASLLLGIPNVRDATAPQRGALDTSFGTFNNHLAGLSPPYDDTNQDTPLPQGGPYFRSLFADVYAKIAALERANVSEASNLSEWDLMRPSPKKPTDYADNTASQPITAMLRATDGRAKNSLILPTNTLVGQKATTDVRITYTIRANDILVTVSAHSIRVVEEASTRVAPYGQTQFALPPNIAWWLYYYDPELLGNPSPLPQISGIPNEGLDRGLVLIAWDVTPPLAGTPPPPPPPPGSFTGGTGSGSGGRYTQIQ